MALKSIETSIRYLKGIGPKKLEAFNAIDINTIEDMLYYFPRRYEDRSLLLPVAQVQEGIVCTVKARVVGTANRTSWRNKRLSIVEVVVNDDSGMLWCVWFNQPYLRQFFKTGQLLVLYGKVERYGSRLQMSSPEFEVIAEGDDEVDTATLVPVYSLPQGMTQRYFRRLMRSALSEYVPYALDALPYDLRSRQGLANFAESLLNIHFPTARSSQQEAYYRLAFEEFFVFQLPLAIRKSQKKEVKGIVHAVEGPLRAAFLKRLPFELTEGQKKVIAEIEEDMVCPVAMQRLLQGDVGSGKTVVATLAMVIAVQGSYQAVLLVPTEILARQHYQKISDQMKGLGKNSRSVRVELLVGSTPAKSKDALCQDLKKGSIDIIIGTHALLEEKVQFMNLGLVVIDEQHKFGVGQRALLPHKGNNPDILIMTATPIPRTLAITVYGDLDISIISGMPVGRKTIETRWVTSEKRRWLYDFIRQQLQQGRQAYVVYPVIEDSQETDLAGAVRMYDEIKAEFHEYQAGLLHGRLKNQLQQEVMAGFKNGSLHIIVATTVLEVGIDVANASVMVVEHADRFGLSQLHQLRGRIGRGSYESYCILVSDSQTDEAKARLTAMVAYSDGFRIAEIDLKLRGPGQFFGQRQHGLSELRIANPLTQLQLLKKAREEALRLIQQDGRLEKREHQELKRVLFKRFPEYEKLNGCRLMRILTGSHKGRKLIMPKGIRPTQDKVRKAIFDIFSDIKGYSFLDLFAGSGAVGLEAWSRGAQEVIFVESNPVCCRIVQHNIEALSAGSCRCYCKDALIALTKLQEQQKAFNIVFLDPPYYEEWGKKALQLLGAYDILPADGFVIIQHSKKDKLPRLSGSLIVCKQASYGDTVLTIYQKQITKETSCDLVTLQPRVLSRICAK